MKKERPIPETPRLDFGGKTPAADAAADSCLELQFSLSNKSRGANILTAVLVMGFIFIFAALIWIIPDRDFSPEENRSLKTIPEFTAEKFFFGDFIDEFAEYLADQFPARNFFVGLKAASETIQLKGQNNDVIFAADGWLVARSDYPDEDILEKNLDSAAYFVKAAAEKGIDSTLAFAGRKQDVYDKLLPGVYGSYYSDRIWSRLDDICTENGLSYINLRDELHALSEGDDGLYYRTDHHWTTHGAYLGYRSIAEKTGLTPYAESDFDITPVTDSFFGTTWSSSGVKWVSGDTINYYRFDGDTQFTMEILDASGKLADREGVVYREENGERFACFEGFYVEDFLSEKDKYASFIGGNFGLTRIKAKDAGEERPTLVVFKDSFSHSMVSMLARHYDLLLIDLRYYNKPMLRFCEENNASGVLFMYNMETLCEGAYLNVLRAGQN